MHVRTSLFVALQGRAQAPIAKALISFRLDLKCRVLACQASRTCLHDCGPRGGRDVDAGRIGMESWPPLVQGLCARRPRAWCSLLLAGPTSPRSLACTCVRGSLGVGCVSCAVWLGGVGACMGRGGRGACCEAHEGLCPLGGARRMKSDATWHSLKRIQGGGGWSIMLAWGDWVGQRRNGGPWIGQCNAHGLLLLACLSRCTRAPAQKWCGPWGHQQPRGDAA